MVEIGDKVISIDLVEMHFACDLDTCKGACCIHGESGAPLEHEEVDLLKEEYPVFRGYLRPEGIRAIEEQDTSVLDADNEMVTPLVDGRECAYTVFEEGIARCALEKAFDEGMISIRKPVSCHIYPVRIRKYNAFKAVYYDRWAICDPARDYGKEKNIRVFRFVREGIERKFGKEFYKQLEVLASQTDQQKK